MKYFFLATSTDQNVTGLVGPQCKAFPKGYNLEWYEKPHSMTKLSNKNFPEIGPELIFELDEKSKLTDFISQSIISARGLLINKRVKNILEQFNLPDHKFYPGKVFYKNIPYQYYWYHLLDNLYMGIDYNKSSFFEGNSAGWKKGNIDILSYATLKNFQTLDTRPMVWAEKISLTNEFSKKNYHMLLFALLHNNIFISEKILSAFISNKITGFKIIEQNIIQSNC